MDDKSSEGRREPGFNVNPWRTARSNDTAEGASSNAEASPWERKLLEKLAFAALREQRAARRWSLFFRLAALVLVLWALWQNTDMFSADTTAAASAGHTAVVSINGVIDAESDASAERVIAALQAAFKDKGTRGIILRINSPGGSPVQSGMINDELRRLRRVYPNKPVHAVIEEICASGAYYVAVATDRIFVDKASLVGSIGVLIDGFGFTGIMDKLGVERRLLTAGENKGFLDPFSPQSEQQKIIAQSMLREIHQQFIDAVRNGRKGRLHETPETFSGLIWTGSQSIGMGLADELGSVDSVARDVFKAEEIVDYTVRENFAERFAKRFGTNFGAAAARALAQASNSLQTLWR